MDVVVSPRVWQFVMQQWENNTLLVAFRTVCEEGEPCFPQNRGSRARGPHPYSQSGWGRGQVRVGETRSTGLLHSPSFFGRTLYLRSHLESSFKSSASVFCNTLKFQTKHVSLSSLPSLQEPQRGKSCLEYLKGYHIYPQVSSPVIWNPETEAPPYILDTNKVALLTHLL